MAARRCSALTLPDLCQVPPHITSHHIAFHLPHVQVGIAVPMYHWEDRLREAEKLTHMSTSGDRGRDFGQRFGKSAKITTVRPYNPVIQTSRIHGGEKQPWASVRKRDKDINAAGASSPWTGRPYVL